VEKVFQIGNLKKFKIFVITLKAKSNSCESLRPLLPKINVALKNIIPGTIRTVSIQQLTNLPPPPLDEFV